MNIKNQLIQDRKDQIKELSILKVRIKAQEDNLKILKSGERDLKNIKEFIEKESELLELIVDETSYIQNRIKELDELIDTHYYNETSQKTV